MNEVMLNAFLDELEKEAGIQSAGGFIGRKARKIRTLWLRNRVASRNMRHFKKTGKVPSILTTGKKKAPLIGGKPKATPAVSTGKSVRRHSQRMDRIAPKPIQLRQPQENLMQKLRPVSGAA